MPSATENQGFSYDAAEIGIDPVDKAYRDALGDGLEKVLGSGADTLEAIVAGLNQIGVTGPTGQRWTEPLLESELNRLSR